MFDPETAGLVTDRIGTILEHLPADLAHFPVSTVFFGGGTPSILPAGAIFGLLNRMRNAFRFAPDTEISVEANPEDITPAWVEEMKNAGVNRFSCGVQSFFCAHTLGRRHTPERAVQAVQELRRCGVQNLNLDMMFALPLQTMPDLEQDIGRLLDLAPEHISWYALTLTPETPLAHAVHSGRWTLPDEETWLLFYDRIQQRLNEAGYEHYEISNWARPGWRCRHNERIWNGADYLGLGPGAASRLGKWRWKDPFPPVLFLQASSPPESWKNAGPPPWAAEAEAVDARGEDLETLLTGIRLPEGFDLDRLHGEIDPDRICSLRSCGLLWQTGRRIGPTRRGLLLSDTVLTQLADGLRNRSVPSCS